MGLLSGFTDALGLTNTSGMEDAARVSAQATQPWGLTSSFGSVTPDYANKTITSSMSPELMALQQGLLSQYGGISPDQQLSLFRQQAAPYNQAATQGLENRLFSQGRLDHSQVYQPGGAMRGLWDAQYNQDLSFQQMAQDQSLQQQIGLLNQYLGLGGLEQGLFSQSFGGGAAAGQGGVAGGQILAQSAMQMPNLMQSLLGGATMGYMMRPG